MKDHDAQAKMFARTEEGMCQLYEIMKSKSMVHASLLYFCLPRRRNVKLLKSFVIAVNDNTCLLQPTRMMYTFKLAYICGAPVQ